uniref:Saposin B-type domain-containing protein n=1 Tax=Panagrolaimus sp. PS1159 TaxID=55785 RepID=A0AC35FA56_9BILA
MKLFAFVLIASILALAFCEIEESEGPIPGETCKMCIRFITKMSKYILEHSGDAKRYGGKVCDILTWGNESLDKKCRKMVNEKIEYIVEKVRASKTSEEICHDIYFC